MIESAVPYRNSTTDSSPSTTINTPKPAASSNTFRRVNHRRLGFGSSAG
jgi:hypothetical protein